MVGRVGQEGLQLDPADGVIVCLCLIYINDNVYTYMYVHIIANCLLQHVTRGTRLQSCVCCCVSPARRRHQCIGRPIGRGDAGRVAEAAVVNLQAAGRPDESATGESAFRI